ncbi:MAG TPA: bifunctional alpha,alpha-trehalose-phosphate synthase (UDP-forming)/trehalose-phosphatase [Nitrospirota bacterium]|nr:bifunctional alpha,alpha-trehalose-phosphate synthase (UDP-forming)/trehalose-phosphatase [Nitrospirota bacterium]
MTSERLAALTGAAIPGKKLILVSNREPYVHKKTGLSIKVERPTGGLTSALDDVLRATGGCWVAWGSGSGDRDVVDEKNRVSMPPENPSYTLKRVWLSPGEADNYYHGYSNQVLWPLCHITLDRVYYRAKFWEDYTRVNRRFADAVLEEAGEETVVWNHDFHLCLMPKFIRERRPGLLLAHFWHIPWPDWSVFRVCPQAGDILEGLLGNDLIGFQIPLFVKNFMDCATACLGTEVDHRRQTVTFNGRTTRLKAFPISVDYEKFHALASSPRTERFMKKLREQHRLEGAQIGLGVDRLEYTKALIKRLQAIHLLFERHARLRGKFTFIQIAVATRMKEPYISYKKTVEELIEKINARYSTKTWKPIIYIDEKVEHDDLVAYYRMADVAVISSVYDGMNLVAKEYAASRVDEGGVLILSVLAGAADELEGAMLVNPYDIEGFSVSIAQALGLNQKEITGRMALLRRHIRENDIYRWVADILHEIGRVSDGKAETCRPVFDHAPEMQERLADRKLFLFLDYDGTLTPIAESPEQARMSDEMRSLLVRANAKSPVAVISGRTLRDVRERVGLEGIVYAGNHGAEIWDGGKTVLCPGLADGGKALQELLNALRKALAHIRGVLVEDKGLTASVHFRMVAANDLGNFYHLFNLTAKTFEDLFRITSGKKVFEIRPLHAWNKGDAVAWIIDNLGGDRMPLYVGDDITDVDAFRAVRERGISVSVGDCGGADYFLKGQEEVARLLEFVLEHAERTAS